MADNQITRFVGGSPVWVAIRLLLLSVVVGVILSALGLDPMNIFASIDRLVRGIFNMGFDAFEKIWRYFVLGAVIVIPLWIILRLAGGGRR